MDRDRECDCAEVGVDEGTEGEKRPVSPERQEQLDKFSEVLDAYSDAMDLVLLVDKPPQKDRDALDQARETVWEELRSPLVK